MTTAALVVVAVTVAVGPPAGRTTASASTTVRPAPTTAPTTSPPTTSPPTTTTVATTLPPTTVPTTTAPAATVPAPAAWRVAWGSAMAWGFQTVTDATVRTVVHTPIPGEALRVRISNKFGNAPLAVTAATVARSLGGPSVVPGSGLTLHFGGATTVTVAPGATVTSDPVATAVAAQTPYAVSIAVSGTDVVTSHYPCCEGSTPSYIGFPGSGNLTGQAGATSFILGAPFSRLVDALEVLQPPGVGTGSIVVLGDSISDGFNTSLRWSTVLQERIAALPLNRRPAVVNEAITANALTAVQPSDDLSGGGPPGVQRLASDILTLPGVATVVVLLGTNDLYFGASAASVIAGLQQAIAEAHQAKVRIVGVTLLPRQGSEGWDPARQAFLDQVNAWIRTSGAFDGVIDLAPVVADTYNGACNPAALFPGYDSGDHLHPNVAGQTAIGDAIPPAVLGLTGLGTVPPVVAVTPTAGCHAPPV